MQNQNQSQVRSFDCYYYFTYLSNQKPLGQSKTHVVQQILYINSKGKLQHSPTTKSRQSNFYQFLHNFQARPRLDSRGKGPQPTLDNDFFKEMEQPQTSLAKSTQNGASKTAPGHVPISGSPRSRRKHEQESMSCCV